MTLQLWQSPGTTKYGSAGHLHLTGCLFPDRGHSLSLHLSLCVTQLAAAGAGKEVWPFPPLTWLCVFQVPRERTSPHSQWSRWATCASDCSRTTRRRSGRSTNRSSIQNLQVISTRGAKCRSVIRGFPPSRVLSYGLPKKTSAHYTCKAAGSLGFESLKF